METIISPLQQRAIDYCDRKQMPKIGRQIAVIAYMHGAEDQDRISRAEERERCIKIAQDAHCELCIAYNHCLISGDVGQPENSPRQCLDREELRKAMKGGDV